MTTTVRVDAHCASDTEVICGVSGIPVTSELVESRTLQSGESHTLYVHGSRIAVVLERKKEAVS